MPQDATPMQARRVFLKRDDLSEETDSPMTFAIPIEKKHELSIKLIPIEKNMNCR